MSSILLKINFTRLIIVIYFILENVFVYFNKRLKYHHYASIFKEIGQIRPINYEK